MADQYSVRSLGFHLNSSSQYIGLIFDSSKDTRFLVYRMFTKGKSKSHSVAYLPSKEELVNILQALEGNRKFTGLLKKLEWIEITQDFGNIRVS